MRRKCTWSCQVVTRSLIINEAFVFIHKLFYANSLLSSLAKNLFIYPQLPISATISINHNLYWVRPHTDEWQFITPANKTKLITVDSKAQMSQYYSKQSKDMPDGPFHRKKVIKILSSGNIQLKRHHLLENFSWY